MNGPWSLIKTEGCLNFLGVALNLMNTMAVLPYGIPHDVDAAGVCEDACQFLRHLLLRKRRFRRGAGIASRNTILKPPKVVRFHTYESISR